MLSQGFAGVYYPSVRVERKGFNVAIHPYYVNSNMKALIKDGKTELIMQPITAPLLHRGREICYKIMDGEIQV
jgi:hypothetical protein